MYENTISTRAKIRHRKESRIVSGYTKECELCPVVREASAMKEPDH